MSTSLSVLFPAALSDSPLSQGRARQAAQRMPQDGVGTFAAPVASLILGQAWHLILPLPAFHAAFAGNVIDIRHG